MQLHTKGAQEQILASLPQESITLYRGTTLFEASTLDLIHALDQVPTNVSSLAPKIDTLVKNHQSLVKYYQENKSDEHQVEKLSALTDFKSSLDQWNQTLNTTPANIAGANLRNILLRFMSQGAFGGVFTTSDPVKADIFSKGAIVSFEIKSEDLMKLNAGKSLYVGLEDQIEIAFLFENGFMTLTNGYKSWMPKEVSNIWN